MHIWLVATTDLRRRVRNRSAIIMAVVAPLALAVVFGLLIGGTDDFEIRLGVVDLDGSAVSSEIRESLITQTDDSPLVAEELDDEAVARARVDDGDFDVAIVLPPGLGSARADDPVVITVLESPDRPISAEVGRAVSQSVSAGFDRVNLTLATSQVLTGSTGDPSLIDRAVSSEPALTVEELPPGGGDIDATAYYGGSMSILFLFFTVGFATRSVLAERQDGTLDRLLATPTPPGALVGGKVVSVSLLALGGFVVTWLVTSVVFGADWGPPFTVLTVIVATVIAIGGVSLFVASLARTPQQADAVTAAVAFALAMVGGNFLGPGGGPEVLQTLRLVTPNGWALQAFTEAAADRAGVGDVLPAVGVLLAIGVVLGAAGLARIHRVVVP